LVAVVAATALASGALLGGATPSDAAGVRPKIYEAEKAAARSATVKTSTKHAGYTGAGFVDFTSTQQSGEYVEWRVDAPAAGKYLLTWRYGNGDNADRPLSLKVNGTNASAKVLMPPISGWANWRRSSVQVVNLRSGTNTVRLTTTSKSGANIDHLSVATPPARSFSAKAPAATKRLPNAVKVYQAEAATRSGAVVATNSAGYTGSGFVDYKNAAGEYVEWKVSVPAAGKYTVSWRYANGGSTSRPLALKVNGTNAAQPVLMPKTGGFGTWKWTGREVTLKAGTNAVRLTSTGLSGANVDKMVVSR
jgi:hypothetical protein